MLGRLQTPVVHERMTRRGGGGEKENKERKREGGVGEGGRVRTSDAARAVNVISENDQVEESVIVSKREIGTGGGTEITTLYMRVRLCAYASMRLCV